MFDLADRPLLWIPVRWDGLKPGENGGLAVEVEHEIELCVELLDREETKSIMMNEDGSPKVGDFDAFTRIVKDWRKIIAGPEGNKKPVEFTDDNIRKLMAIPAFPNAFVYAYASATIGKIETRLGNSESSPGIGQEVA